MTRPLHLTSLTLTSGDTIDASNAVTAIVGPNNTGKSSLLRELNEHLATHRNNWHARSSVVLDSMTLSFEPFDSQLDELDSLFSRRPPGTYPYGQQTQEHYRLTNGQILPIPEIQYHWGSSNGLGVFASYVVTYLDAESRLGLTYDVSSFDTYRESPTTPLQVLFARRDLEDDLSALTSSAFGIAATVGRYSGSQIHLHAGKTTSPELSSPQTQEYLEELNALPLMHTQGDGMRAFTGMAMSILAGHRPLVLIDEPEAFLHPPQARRFGQFLADHAVTATGVQVLVATHSEDIISGLTSRPATSGGVSVVRLTRHGKTNHVAQLAPDAVHELIDDPLIKFYNMLNGLFATGVVLCEADSDCTYYRAALGGSSAADTYYIREAHFTHTSGKARIATAMSAFRATAVPAACIVDIDMLQDDGELAKLVRAAGGDYDTIRPLRNVVASAVDARATGLRRNAVKSEVEEILARASTRQVSKADIKALREAVTARSGWRDLKLAGSSLLTGDASRSFESIREILEGIGIFILEQGELERLHPSVPQANKSEWLRQVIESGAFAGSPATPMLVRLSQFLASAQATTQPEPARPALEP